jgi:CBS domain-containing protein
MASNKIITRVKDFLQINPPFSYLPNEILIQIASEVEIIYLQDEEYIFQEEEPHRDFGFVLKKGRIELLKKVETQIELLDVCEEGDVFGVRSLLTSNPYMASARSSGDSLVYAIPRKIATQIINEYPQVSLFFAAGFAAGQTIVNEDLASKKTARKDLRLFQAKSAQINEVLLLNPVREVVICSPITTVQEAAEQMKKRRVGSIVVLNEKLHPIGMVSDSDFTRKVIAGSVLPSDQVTKLMSSPVITLPPDVTIARFTIQLMKNGIRRIVITEDGTDNSPIFGILSEREMLAMQGNNPATLVRRMWKARSVQQLSDLRNRADEIIINYLQQEVSIEFIADIITEINDTLIEKAIVIAQERLEQEEVPNPNLRWVWLSLGSEGRGEQLLRTDQDNAILYEDPSKEKTQVAQIYFLKLGQYVVDTLVECGFKRCKGDIMASNSKWNQSISNWKSSFSHWLKTPSTEAVMHGNIFFDFRAGYGDHSLADELSDFILKIIEKRESQFSMFFVKDSLDTPAPLSFFKNFIVERSGKHKDMFDIKKRAMIPLAAAARMLIIIDKVKGINNTFERFRKLAELYPNHSQLFGEAAEAYEIFTRYRALNAFENKDSGRFIQPKNLNKIQRQTLRTAFQSIEAVQRHLRLRFSLN